MLLPLLTLPLVALAALFATRRWHVLAYALGALALLPPLWPGAVPILRFMIAIGACGGLARVVELVGERESPARRVLRALTLVDWRTSSRVPRRTDPLRLLAVLGYGATAALAIDVALRTRPGPLWPAWILGALAVWAMSEAVNAAFAFGLGLAGVRIAPLHDRPLVSRSLAELWGRRWNLTVSRWLHKAVFAPLALRHHATLGVLATFVASALFHAYVSGAAGGPIVALVMATYFIVEGMLMVAERALQLRGSRAWFLAAVLVPSPLFVEPMIAIVRPLASPLGQHAARVEPQALQAR